MTLKTAFTASTALLLLSTTAHAHDGDHTAPLLANILHWLSSPTHSLFAVIAGAAFIVLAHRLYRKAKNKEI